MDHGIQAYFRECERFGRRLALLTAGLSLGAFGVLGLCTEPHIRDALNDPKRFGLEGPDQYVERILLQDVRALNRPVGPAPVNFVTRESKRGGTTEKRKGDPRTARPDSRRSDLGPGRDEEDLLARARLLRSDAPVVRSEEMVAIVRVQPEYPEEAHNKNLEGTVEIIALVDTLGIITEVEVTGGTRDRTFERAATEAVWRWRFRPYEKNGIKSEANVRFHFWFHLF